MPRPMSGRTVMSGRTSPTPITAITIITTACMTATSRRSVSCASSRSREALRLLLDALQQNLGPGLLRVKGIVHVAEEPDRPAVIQGAQHLLHNLSWLDRW